MENTRLQTKTLSEGIATDNEQTRAAFRLFLQEELVRRCQKNPKYSLRAFALLLEVENSALSKILNGKRKLTSQMIQRFSEKLNLSPQELAEVKNRFNVASTTEADALATYRQVTLDQFAIIADWYHYAIHELVKIKNAKHDVRWIAKTLNISQAEAGAAIERLLRLGYLEKDKKGRFVNCSGPLSTLGNKFTAVAFRKLQRQILEKAIVSLETVPMEERDNTSMTMAISTKHLPAAKEMIKGFRRQLSAFLEKDQNNLDAVYHLGIALYPVSSKEK